MLENAVSRRYAQAFFALAQETNNVDKLESELQIVVNAINDNDELKKVMEHQLVSPDEKKAIINAVFAQDVSETTMNFLDVVIDKYRASYIPGVYEEFVAYANATRNMIDALVKSAVELTDSDLETIKGKLAAATGKTVRLQSELDPSLIGGVVVRIGDRVVDGSLAGRLAKLKDNLLKFEVKEIGVRN